MLTLETEKRKRYYEVPTDCSKIMVTKAIESRGVFTMKEYFNRNHKSYDLNKKDGAHSSTSTSR